MVDKKEKETTETTEVATKENTTVAAPTGLTGLEAFGEFKQAGQPIVGFEEVSAEDIKMPKIKLAQPTSQEVTDEKCKGGQYFNVTTGDVYDYVDCTLLSLGKGRVKWPEQFKRGEDPLCKSFDGKISETGVHCDSCPDCKWADGADRPACNQVYMWLGILENGGSPFRVSMSGTAVSKTKDFITEVAKFNLPPFVFKIRLGSEKQKNERGTYYVPTYTLLKDEGTGQFKTIKKEEFKDFEDLTKSLQSLFMNARQRDIVDSESAAQGEGGGLF